MSATNSMKFLAEIPFDAGEGATRALAPAAANWPSTFVPSSPTPGAWRMAGC